jgi:glucose-6-phosphate isomerase
MHTQQLRDLYSLWPSLEEHRQGWDQQTLAELFRKDSNRAMRFRTQAAGLELDYSKNFINEEALKLLVDLARQADLPGAIKRLLSGQAVNNTENRPAWHSALRHTGAPTTDAHRQVNDTLERMGHCVNAVHTGQWRGFSGESITDVINIGIGGSDLGPRMVTKALTPYHTGAVRVHFVANIDGAELTDLLRQLNPARSLFIVASKSFSTQETLENALSARAWMLQQGCPETLLAQHFVAISSRVDKAVQFGMAAENVFPIWDWVGGRYSLWSAIGLPIAMAVGMDNFNRLRQGAHAMDQHFAEAPLEKNLPVILGLLMFWYSEFFAANTQAVLPYAYHLQLLPNYLQQLEMESNGKSVSRSGTPLGYPTGAIVWGTEGTNGQHSFHQLLHQGTAFIPVDFIASLQTHSPLKHQHRLLFANCVAQSQALLTGRSLEMAQKELKSQGASDDEVTFLAAHKVHPGNRPSNTLVMDLLTPETLGALIAAYEHKVFTLGVLLNINSFDQWGVELGKLLGNHVNTALESTDIPGDWDSSTAHLVRRFCDSQDAS